MKKISFIEKYYLAPWLVNIALVLVYLFGVTGSPLYTSVLNVTVKADPFTGTVMPFSMVPDYRIMTDRTLKFTEIDSNKFIQIPKYDPEVFGRNLDNLEVGSTKYKETQIARFIYTVPYMGTYNSDYKEYAGSHLAVDIKAPIGTPVKSIANGVVVMSDYQASGYGNVIVVRHENVDYRGKKINLFSGYAHLSERSVKAGDKVSKGEVIGLVGNTGGTSTGSHLHFQIDVDGAPYHLYWPFSSKDTRDAGVSFYQGISSGVGKENAMKYTIHPMDFVYKYENNSVESPKDNISVVIEKPEENKPNKEEEKPEENNQEQEKQDSVISADDTKKEEEKKEEKEDIADVNINENVVSGIGSDFSSGFDSGTLNINSYDTVSLLDEDEEKLDLNSAPEKPAEEKNNNTEEDKTSVEEPKEEETSVINNENKEENKKEEDKKENKKFIDVKSSHKYYRAIEYYRSRGLISGYSDGSFKPDNNISRIENLKMLSVGAELGTSIDKTQYFKDVPESSWQLKYVNQFVRKKVLSLNNTNFNPNNKITRIEGLKLLLKSQTINISAFAEMKIDAIDVKPTDWFYPYVVYAVKNNLLEYSNNKFEPNKPLTRGEVVNMMYLMK